jgi:hypothetical protein
MDKADKKRREVYDQQHKKAHTLSEQLVNLTVRASLRDREMSLGTLLCATSMAQTALITFLVKRGVPQHLVADILMQGAQCGADNVPLLEMHEEELAAFDNRMEAEIQQLSEEEEAGVEESGLDDELVVEAFRDMLGLPPDAEARVWRIDADGKMKVEEEEPIFPTMKGGDA